MSRASPRIRLTQEQVRCGELVKRDLQTERANYLRMMQTLLASANNVCESNEQLKAAIIERQKQVEDAKREVEQIPENTKVAQGKLRKATQRLKKYRRQVSKRTKGVSMNKIQSEIEKLKNEMAQMRIESQEAKEKVEAERKVVQEIVELSGLKNELVEMNQKLREIAQKMLDQVGTEANDEDDEEIMQMFENLRAALEKNAQVKLELKDKDPEFDTENDDEVFRELDERLKQTVPIFHELEKLLQDNSRATSQISRLSSAQMSEFCSELLRSDRFRSSVLSSIRATTAPGGMRVSALDFARGEMWSSKTIRSSLAPVSLAEFCDDSGAMNGRRRLGLIERKRRPLSADQAKVMNALFLASRNGTGQKRPTRPTSAQVSVRPKQEIKRSLSDVEASLNAMTSIFAEKGENGLKEEGQNRTRRGKSALQKERKRGTSKGRRTRSSGKKREDGKKSRSKVTHHTSDNEELPSQKQKIPRQTVKKSKKHDGDEKGRPKSVIRHKRTDSVQKKEEPSPGKTSTLRRRRKLSGSDVPKSPEREFRSDSEVYHSPDRKKLTPTSMKQRDLFSLSDSFSGEVEPVKPKPKPKQEESFSELSDSEEPVKITTLANAKDLFATDTSASPQKPATTSDNLGTRVEKAASTEVIPPQKVSEKPKIEKSKTAQDGALSLGPHKFRVAPKDILIRLFDSDGQEVKSAVKIDENGDVRGKNIYDENGTAIKNLKRFIPRFAKSVTATKKLHAKKHKLKPQTPEQPKPRERPKKSRLGKKVEGLPIFKYKSKFAEKMIKREMELARIHRVPSSESIDPSVSPMKTTSEFDIGDGKFIQFYDEFDEEGQPTRTSRVAWARALLRRAITSQLSRTERAVAISDAQVALVDLEGEIQELNDQAEFERNRAKYEPDMRIAAVVEDEYFSAEPKIVMKTDTAMNSDLAMAQLDEVMGDITELNKRIAIDFISNQQRKVAESDLPQLENWLQQLRKENLNKQKVINTLQARLNLINANDGLTRETQMRREFEASMDTRTHTIEEIDTETVNGEQAIEELTAKIEEQKFIHEQLKKKISVAQREPKPDLMKICIDMDHLRAASKHSNEKLKQAELEMSFYDDCIKRKRSLIAPANTEEIQSAISGLRERLSAQKTTFASRMRKEAADRTIPYTTASELIHMSSRSSEITRQINNLKRKEDFIRHKIDKLVKILESYDIHITAQ